MDQPIDYRRSVLSHLWKEGMAELRQFVDQHGHPFVSREFEANSSFNLGMWVHLVRGYELAERLTPHQVRDLHTLAGWTLWRELDALAVR